MRQLVDQALSLAQELEPAFEEAPSETDLDLAFGPSTEKHPQPARGGASTGTCDGVAAYCFALQHELRPVADALSRCEADHEEILVACDRAGRKLRRSLSALASTLARAEGRPSNLPESWVDRAGSAVAVRTLYAKFRKALASGPDGTDSAQVARALRRAATALAVLCGDEDFGEVRIQDRLLLRSLQRRILAWGRSPHVQEGLRLYGDIWAAGELLRAINMRQELRAHDADLVEGVCASLETEFQNERALREILGRLRALRGLDDELDDVLWRAYGGTPVRELDGPLRQAMTRLQATLCGAGATPNR
jgi:hypothetical protein